jgi:hypothetical protein
MKTPTRYLLLPLLAALLGTAWASSVLAAEAAKGTVTPSAEAGTVLSLGKGKPTGALLTRDQLRACLKSQTAIKADSDALLKEKNELAIQKAEMDRVEAELVAERTSVDATKEETVAAYNDKLAAAKTRSAALRERQLGFNAKVDAYQASNDGFKRDCADRPYAELDWFAIQRGK